MKIFKMSAVVALGLWLSFITNLEVNAANEFVLGGYMDDLQPINCFGNQFVTPYDETGITEKTAGGYPFHTAQGASTWYMDTQVQRPCYMRITAYADADEAWAKTPVVYTQPAPVTAVALAAADKTVGSNAKVPGLLEETFLKAGKGPTAACPIATFGNLMDTMTELIGVDFAATKVKDLLALVSGGKQYAHCSWPTAKYKGVGEYDNTMDKTTHSSDGTDAIGFIVKPGGTHLYFQVTFNLTAFDGQDETKDTKMYIVLAESQMDWISDVNTIMWAHKDNKSTHVNNAPAKLSYIYIAAAIDPTGTFPEFKIANFQNKIEFYKERPSATECSSKKCPATIFIKPAFTDNDGVKQAWIAITLPAVNSALMNENLWIVAAKDTTLSQGNTSDGTKGVGTTFLPKGACVKNTACNVSIFVEAAWDTGAAELDAITMVNLCAWPKYECIPDIAWKVGSEPGENTKYLGKDSLMNGGADVITSINYNPNAAGIAPLWAQGGNVAATPLQFTTKTANEANYQILIQANANTQLATDPTTQVDIRGWKLTSKVRGEADYAGGTEYIAQGKIVNDTAGVATGDCLNKYGCGAYGSLGSDVNRWVRNYWPHSWENTGFQLLSPVYSNYKVNETSYKFATEVTTKTFADATSLTGVEGLQGIANHLPATVDHAPYHWRVFALEAVDSSAHKLSYQLQTGVEIVEHAKTASGGLMITRIQLDTEGTAALNNVLNWATGDTVREVTATTNSGANAVVLDGSFSYRPTYNWATTSPAKLKRNFGLHVASTIAASNGNTNGGAQIYFVNQALVKDRVLGNCTLPTWQDDAGYFWEVAKANLPAVTSNADCDGLMDGGTAPTKCMLVSMTTGIFHSGIYEIWYQGNTNSMPYSQTTTTTQFTIAPFTTELGNFIDSSSINIAAGGKKQNPTFEYEYNLSAVTRIEYTVTAGLARTDQVGFIMYKDVGDGVNPPPSVERNLIDKLVQSTNAAYATESGTVERWIRNCKGNQAVAIGNLGSASDIKDCIKEHGVGTYYLYVQVLGSTKYVKQAAYFKVAHATTYATTSASVIKSIKWKPATDQTTPTAIPGKFIFDDVERTVCDVYADKGSQRKDVYDGSNSESMRITLQGGVGNLEANDHCYIQIFEDIECKTPSTTAINGKEPGNVGIVRDYMNNAISGACQTSGPVAVSPDKFTDANYYQVPKEIASQLGPNMCLKMWVRKENKKWIVQSDPRLVLEGYAATDTTSSTTLITDIKNSLKNADGTVKPLTIKHGGDSIGYTVSVFETTTNKNNNIPRLCLKPVLTGTKNDLFIRYYDSKTAFCNSHPSEKLPTGNGKSWTATLGMSYLEMYPGVYDVYSKYADNASSDPEISYCKSWAKQNIQVTYEWTKDSLDSAQSWSGTGYTLDGSIDYIHKYEKKDLSKEDILKWNATVIQELRLNITYSKQIVSAADHIVYWSKADPTTAICDCSKERCTRLKNDLYPPNCKTTQILSGAPMWPSTGSPGCQYARRTFETHFPEDGQYYLCVAKDRKYKGFNVQVSDKGANVNVSLHINPAPPAGTPVTTVKPVPASSSTLSSLFAIIAAVLGAFLL